MAAIHHYTAQEAITYVQENTTLFSPGACLAARTITDRAGETDGYVNIIHLIQDKDSGQSVALKQVLPYVRAAQENGVHIPVPVERSLLETAVFKLWRTIAPEIIPEVYWQDVARGILIMEDLSGLNLLRFELMKMRQLPQLPAVIGSFLGKSAFYFSEMYLQPDIKKELAQTFASPQMHTLFEKFIFEETFFASKPISPLVQQDLAQLLANQLLLREVLLLKDHYALSSQTLIHNDLHTSNICVNGTAVKIFDAESVCFGPIAFDLARLIGNLLLNYASWEGVATVSQPEKEAYQAYLLRLIAEMFQNFAQTFTAVYAAEARDAYRQVDSYPAIYLRQVLQDMVGFAGCVCLSRIYDEAECYEFQQFRSLAQKAAAQKLAIQFTQALIVNRNQVNSIVDFIALIEETHEAYRLKQIVQQTIFAWQAA